MTPLIKNCAWPGVSDPPNRCAVMISSAHGRSDQVPQTLPVLQLELELLPNEKVLPPESLEAKVEIFLVTF
jgi:hypothetical protein